MRNTCIRIIEKYEMVSPNLGVWSNQEKLVVAIAVIVGMIFISSKLKQLQNNTTNKKVNYLVGARFMPGLLDSNFSL